MERTPNNHSLWKKIVKWILNHSTIRQSKEHFKNFWFIWELLFSLVLGVILFSSILAWQYSRILLVVLVACIIWKPIKVICGKTIKGRVLFLVIIVLLTIVTCKFFPYFTPQWVYNQWWCRIMLIGLTLLIILRPMNAVYGLMGTSGSIRIFFFNFFVISLIFASIYYFGFFKTAGITYDINQPHIDYQLFEETSNVGNVKKKTTDYLSVRGLEKILTKRDTMYLEHQLDSLSFTETLIHTTRDTLHYQKIDFMQVWRSTILTTLTQEATDLLTIATVYNSAIESTDAVLDKEKSELFEWILIFHIIISWIFFGVFISLLYNKFRYES